MFLSHPKFLVIEKKSHIPSFPISVNISSSQLEHLVLIFLKYFVLILTTSDFIKPSEFIEIPKGKEFIQKPKLSYPR